MGCCLFALLGGIWPRLALVYLYFFTPIPNRIFHTTLYPLLGFIFMPTTTLAYELCLTYVGPIDYLWTRIIVFIAFLHDLGQLGILRGRRK
jgi:hypothetical protein